MKTVNYIVSAIAALGFLSQAHARDQIEVVGSSTVFPFATSVAEQFGRTSKFKTPVVESTGSGGGLKLFCAGIGLEHPDVTNASRRIKEKEFKKCQANGIDLTEIVIGFDGIVLANAKNAPQLKLTRQQIYLATAKVVPDPNKKCQSNWCEPIANPYKKWSDIDASLPDAKIEILGPPPTSGTRDAFQELAMSKGANKFIWRPPKSCRIRTKNASQIGASRFRTHIKNGATLTRLCRMPKSKFSAHPRPQARAMRFKNWPCQKAPTNSSI